MKWLALFVLSIVICGLKMPFNWLFPSGPEVDRKAAWLDRLGLFAFDLCPALDDAWFRIQTEGRWMHDVTNLAIEWNRCWLPWSTKFLCALIVWPWLFFFAFKVVSFVSR